MDQRIRVLQIRRKIPKSLDEDCLKLLDKNWNIICQYCFYPVSLSDFKSTKEKKEFSQSGYCARCQDDVHKETARRKGEL